MRFASPHSLSPLFARSFRPTLVSALTLAVMGAMSIGFSPVAQAQVVFDNGSPDNRDAFPSNPLVRSYSADTFRFTATTTLNTVTWFGSYYNGAPGYVPTLPDNFTLSFHNTSGTGAKPTAAARTGQTFTIGSSATRIDTGGAIGGDAVYQYSVTLPSALTFSAGTYGISIVNNTTSGVSDPRVSWSWATSNLTGTNYYRASPTGTFFPNDSMTPGDLAFRLSNVVSTAAPEPGSLALLLPVVGTVGVVIRRRQSRNK